MGECRCGMLPTIGQKVRKGEIFQLKAALKAELGLEGFGGLENQ
jgi:hypothetical protein